MRFQPGKLLSSDQRSLLSFRNVIQRVQLFSMETGMESLWGTIQVLMYCGTALAVLFVILLSMPQSQLRAFLLPIVAWVVAIVCGVLVISPVDILPEAFFGPLALVDDVFAAVAGVSAATVAMRSGRKIRVKEE